MGAVAQSKAIKKEPKPISEIVKLQEATKSPKKPWKCEACGVTNTNWLPTVARMFGEVGEQWRHGVCGACERLAEEQKRKAKEEEAQGERRSRILKLHRSAALPREMSFTKFQDLERRQGAEEAFDEMEQLNIAEDRTWVCLYGDNNTGKSKLLAATSNRQNGQLVPTLYVNESLFFTQVKASWETNTEGEVMGVFKLPDLVLWDEFLFYNYMDREWVYERAYALLEYLAEMDKKVVFATNIMNPRRVGEGDAYSVEGRCGKRVWARLRRRNTRFIKMQNKPFF
jgi:DNA replication protein DnaC